MGQRCADLPSVAADDTLLNMEIILCEKVKGVSVEHHFEMIYGSSFLPSQRTEEINNSFHQRQKQGIISPWEQDTTKYGKMRRFCCITKTNSSCAMDPVVTQGKEQQFAKILKHYRSILHIHIDLDGIICQIRYVVTRVGGTIHRPKLLVQVGIFCSFINQSMLISIINESIKTTGTKDQRKVIEMTIRKCNEHALATRVTREG